MNNKYTPGKDIILVERTSCTDFILFKEADKGVGQRIVRNRLKELLQKTRGFNTSENGFEEIVCSGDTIVTEQGKTYCIIYQDSEVKTSDSRLKAGLSELDIGRRARVNYDSIPFEERTQNHGRRSCEKKTGILCEFMKSYRSGEGYIYHARIAFIEGSVLSVTERLESIEFL